MKAQIATIEMKKLLQVTEMSRGLINPFINRTATPPQSHDLLNFRAIGQRDFNARIIFYSKRT